MKYGCRAHDYGCFTAQELARTLADQGYNAAQLAMPKAIRGIADMNGISPEQLEEIRTAFAEADVEIMSPHYMAMRDGNESTIPKEDIKPQTTGTGSTKPA